MSVEVVCKVRKNLEPKHRDELPQHAVLEVVYRPVAGVAKLRERLIQDQLTLCMNSVIRRDQMPRTLVQIVVQGLSQPDLDYVNFLELSSAVNAANSECINEGVEMSGIVIAVALGLNSERNILDLRKQKRGYQLDLKCAACVAVRFSNYRDGEFNKEIVLGETKMFSPVLDEEILRILEFGSTLCAEIYTKLYH